MIGGPAGARGRTRGGVRGTVTIIMPDSNTPADEPASGTPAATTPERASAPAAADAKEVPSPGGEDIDDEMLRRARMTRKFTQLRESIASEDGGETVLVPQPPSQDGTAAAAAAKAEPGDGDDGSSGADGDGASATASQSSAVPNWVDALAHCLTGGIAGILANAIIFPIDVAKTRMQVETPIFPPGLRGLALVKSFYSGLVLGALETGAVHASSFLFYDYLKGRWIRMKLGRGLQPGEESPKLPIATHLLLGVIASLGTQHVTLPLKVMLIRIQGGNSAGLVDAARRIMAESGLLGFWAGSQSTLWMATNPSVTYVLYERMQRWFSDRNRRQHHRQQREQREEGEQKEGSGTDAADGSSDSSSGSTRRQQGQQQPVVIESQAKVWQNLLAGFVAKAVATVYTFPIQKTQAMVQASDEFNGSQLAAIRAIAFPKQKTPSINAVMATATATPDAAGSGSGSEQVESLSVGNVLGLWRGIGPKLLQAALQQALIFRIKEIITKPTLTAVHRCWLQGRRRRHTAATPDRAAAPRGGDDDDDRQ